MKILVIEANRPPRVAEIDGGLKSMQCLVGGYIEVVYPFDEQTVALVCDEEGKLDGSLLNRVIRTEYLQDWIYGTFFLCSAKDGEPDFSSLSEEQLEKYSEMFQNFVVKEGK